MYVLGIDGGGTKTKGVLVKSTGEIIAEATVGATNPNSVGKDDLVTEFTRLFSQLRLKSGSYFTKVKQIYAGMSGVDHPEVRGEMERLISESVHSPIPITVNNDAITALYSGTLGKPGIVQIGGTGSITFGLNQQGELDRVGGWGYLLGEKGSGYALGSQALESAFRAYDGIGEKTTLHDLILRHFELEHLPDVIQKIYQAKNSKEVIASLSREVVMASEQGDVIAQQIIDENATYIAEAITCLIHKRFQGYNEKIPIVFTGGLFTRLDMFQDKMEDYFNNAGLNVSFIKPEMEPVGGAVVVALLQAGVQISKGFSLKR